VGWPWRQLASQTWRRVTYYLRRTTDVTEGNCYVYSNIDVPTRCTCYRVYFMWRLLYMFRVSLSPVFRSTKQLNYSIW
jgi:hypothetical protein